MLPLLFSLGVLSRCCPVFFSFLDPVRASLSADRSPDYAVSPPSTGITVPFT
jgi:hypothetical protein